jgi:hypothetical protein
MLEQMRKIDTLNNWQQDTLQKYGPLNHHTDIVITYETLLGLSLGKWVDRLYQFTPYNSTGLFSTAKKMKWWDSHHFCMHYAIPILEVMRLISKPTLRAFSNKVSNRLQDKITSLHS